jgi:Sap, sulfolipid-1-addressing protein
MGRDLGSVFVLSALAAFNPSLLAAVALMLLLPHAKRLMLGYLLGAYTTSLIAGIGFLFVLPSSGVVTTSRPTLGPGGDIVIGAAALAAALVLATHRDAAVRRLRARLKKGKAERRRGEPWHLRLLGKGSPGVTFVVGALLSFPGVSYLSALDHIGKLHPGVLPAILLVVFFCAMQQSLIELPLVGYAMAPEWTPTAVGRFRGCLQRSGRRLAILGLAAVAALLIIRGVISLAS